MRVDGGLTWWAGRAVPVTIDPYRHGSEVKLTGLAIGFWIDGEV